MKYSFNCLLTTLITLLSFNLKSQTYYNVTFNVHTDLIAGNISTDGIYIGGGFVGGNDALQLSDPDGDGIWSGTLSLPSSGGHFTILNGNCPDWSCKEIIAGQFCSDPNNWDDRNVLLGGFTQDTTLNLQFGTCASPGSCPHTFNLYDSYGDGWNGGSVDVLVNGACCY